MKQRCTNPRNQKWHLYGGRGIKVCRRWLESFANFIEDMGPRPTSGHCLERSENDGHYEPDNCVWATPKEQARNTRRTVLIEIDGLTKCRKDWLSHFGMSLATFLYRTRITGMNDVEALTGHVRGSENRKSPRGRRWCSGCSMYRRADKFYARGRCKTCARNAARDRRAAAHS